MKSYLKGNPGEKARVSLLLFHKFLLFTKFVF